MYLPKTTELNDMTNLLGLHISDTNERQLLEKLILFSKTNGKSIIAYVNVHALNLAFTNPRFFNFIRNAKITFCDGHGVSLASKILNGEFLPRMTPPDWIPQLCEECAKERITLFILGSKEGVALKAANNLQRKFPKLIISGAHHGYFNKNKNSIENKKIINKINKSNTNILLVGFGMPIQEYWIEENLENLQVNVILPVGAAIDYLAGETKRAPKWLTDNGFEWLGRLLIEPGRLWERYIVGLPLFFFRVFLIKFGLLDFPKNKG